jgi:hypothetical protein
MNVWFITKDLLLNDHAAVKPGSRVGAQRTSCATLQNDPSRSRVR